MEVSVAAVSVTTTLHAKPGSEEALAAALRSLAARVRCAEPGCLLYQPTRSRHESGRFLVLERYRDERALGAHANSDHLREALPGLMECLAALPEVAVFHELRDDAAGPPAQNG